ncbi:DUF1643 domain-containing protein [Salinibacterium sp. NG253]|uniref:DUF1643 domain-containing protein n=1 Tax=Salinibacterium sp. NG253 TaxID=2792039 RepID=UPI0018CD5AE7|nr:DUF1643 domain-containing protein [Salinibacterium sp. NG253]
MSSLSQNPAGRLAVVLSNPPTTSGSRTLQRVELARQVLGYESVVTANLFSIATYRTTGISEAGADAAGWLGARPELATLLASADAVVLAYGCREPAGAARHHFRDQLSWLQGEMRRHSIPTWMLADRPRHPSRWHRHTHAAHPELPFAEALSLVLRPVDRAVD